jgi:hypothetical protein
VIRDYVNADSYPAETLNFLDEALARAVGLLGIKSDQERESVAAAILHGYMSGILTSSELVDVARNAHAGLVGPMRATGKWPRK